MSEKSKKNEVTGLSQRSSRRIKSTVLSISAFFSQQRKFRGLFLFS